MINDDHSSPDIVAAPSPAAARRTVRLPNISGAETFVQEINVLQLEGLLFDFSRKHGDKTLELSEQTDGTGRRVRLRFDPHYQRPGILAYRVLQAVFRKLTKEGYPFEDTVSFSRKEIMELAGRGNSTGGAQGQELYRAIQQLRRSDIECEFLDKENDRRDRLSFSLVNSALFSEHKGRVQACSLVPDPMIIKSLNDRHWAAFNWDRMKHLDPVAMVLYKQLFWQMCRLAGRTVKQLETARSDHPMVVKANLDELRYNKDLGDIFAHWLGGLKMPPRKGKIVEKYGARFEALKTTGLIRSYTIEKSSAEGGFTLVVRPGKTFIADYLELYLSRYQPQLKYDSAHDRASIAEPLVLVGHFFQALSGQSKMDTDVFSEKDRAFASFLIGKYGFEAATQFATFAVAAAKADRYPVRQFIGVKQYVNAWLAGRDLARRQQPTESQFADAPHSQAIRPIGELIRGLNFARSATSSPPSVQQ